MTKVLIYHSVLEDLPLCSSSSRECSAQSCALKEELEHRTAAAGKGGTPKKKTSPNTKMALLDSIESIDFEFGFTKPANFENG